MISNNIIVLDFETTSKSSATCQPTQIAACCINSRLEIIDQFDSYIKIEMDEDKCKEMGVDPLTQEVIDITKIKKSTLEKAPELKVVWHRFGEWVNLYNYKKTKWTAPVAAGWNVENYDMKIINRICGEKPYKFGPYDETYKLNNLFHPIHVMDCMRLWAYWSFGLADIKSISLDNTRDYFEMSKAGAHNAIQDVKDTANILIRFLKFSKVMGPKTNFKGCFGKKDE